MKPVNQEPLVPSMQEEAIVSNTSRHFSTLVTTDTNKIWSVASNFLVCQRSSDLSLKGKISSQ